MRRPYASDGGPLAPQSQAAMRRSHYTQQLERPMGEIVTELWENTEVLVRNEIALAMSEVDQRTQKAKTDITRITASGVAMYTGFVSVVVAAVLMLDKVMELWAAALLVGLVLVAAGYFVLPHRKPRDATPREQRSSSYALKEMRS
jgi:hypothetical protein